MTNLAITTHAAQRYRERISRSGDALEQLRQRFSEARLCSKKELAVIRSGMIRSKHSVCKNSGNNRVLYWFYEPDSLVMVTRRDGGTLVLATCFRVNMGYRGGKT